MLFKIRQLTNFVSNPIRIEMKKQITITLIFIIFAFGLFAQDQKVVHMVMFKFKSGFNFESPLFQEAEKLAKQLPSQIDAIKSFESGRNFSSREIAYDYGLIIRFDNNDDLKHYIQHEYHQKVVLIWKEIADWVIVDF